MKKRLLAALMTSAMMVSMLAGCGSTGGETTTPEGGETAESGDGYSMTLIMSLRDEFLSTLEAGAQSAAEELGVTLATQDANNDTGKTIQFIEAARNAGDDAVLVNMVDAATAQQCIDAAGDMKVIFVNRVPQDTSVLGGNSAAVVSDENQSGGYQGQFLVDYFKAKWCKPYSKERTKEIVDAEIQALKAELYRDFGLEDQNAQT